MNGDERLAVTDWKFDFSNLPYWDNRQNLCGVYDRFFEIPQSDALCCLYSIYEVSMCSYLGFFAILKHKDDPQLIWKSEINFRDNFCVNSEGNLIFLQPYLYDRNRNQSECPILILDIEKNRFSCLRTNNRSSGYKVVEKTKTLFVIEADEYQRKHNKELKALHGKKIRINWLKWNDLHALSSLPDLIFGT